MVFLTSFYIKRFVPIFSFQYKTILYDLAPDGEKGRAVITKYLDVVFPKHKHKIKDKDISPRTVKLTNQGQGYQLMGLCRVKEV